MCADTSLSFFAIPQPYPNTKVTGSLSSVSMSRVQLFERPEVTVAKSDDADFCTKRSISRSEKPMLATARATPIATVSPAMIFTILLVPR